MFRNSQRSIETLRDPSIGVSRLNSFWRELADADVLRLHCFGVELVHADIADHADNVATANSVFAIQPFVYRQWSALTLRESELLNGGLVTYDSGRVYDDGTIYDLSTADTMYVPTTLSDVGYIQSSILEPDIVWGPGDFVIADSRIYFLRNPFDVFPSEEINGTRVITLWLRNTCVDRDYINSRFGRVIGTTGVSSPSYAKVVAALWTLLVNGPSFEALNRGIHAATNTPYCEGDETVEQIVTDSDYLHIITSVRVYSFNKNAVATVSVGDTLTAGQPLTDALAVIDGATRPEIRGVAFAGLPSIVIPSRLSGLASDIAFENIDSTWTMVGAQARLPVVGDPATVSTFWSQVAAREAASTPMDSLLGITGSGQRAVNPMEFVVDNILGANTLLVKAKPELFLKTEPTFFVRFLSLLPLGKLLFTIQDLGSATDSFDTTTVTESVGVRPAAALTETISDSGYDLSYTDYAPMVTAL